MATLCYTDISGQEIVVEEVSRVEVDGGLHPNSDSVKVKRLAFVTVENCKAYLYRVEARATNCDLTTLTCLIEDSGGHITTDGSTVAERTA